MDMEKRTLLAVVISILIILGWNLVYQPPQPPQETAVELTEEQPVAAVTAPEDILPAAQTAAQAEDQSIEVDTPLYTAIWSTRGARLVSFKLKQYSETMDEDSPAVEMISEPLPAVTLSGGFSDRDLVFATDAAESVRFSDQGGQLIFSAPLTDGVNLQKIFSIDPESYTIGFKTRFVNDTAAGRKIDYSISMRQAYPTAEKAKRYTFEGPVLLYNENQLEELKISKIKNTGQFRPFSGAINWLGFEDKYFIKTLIPEGSPQTAAEIRRLDSTFIAVSYSVPQSSLNAGQTAETSFSLYIGPKELTTLRNSGFGLEKALDFGFFDIIAKPLLRGMNWIQQYTNSYGWAIIILTFLIKVLLYPLSLKSFTSMKELQKVQPLMKEIQEKHKDDREKLNQELMKLYQDHHINPMGGCLPMLLQIPILFALYRVFLSAIELRHTPFHIFGTWLPDLSARDPYFITPILMGLSQFIMQKMTPTAGDPTQQKMMLIMPVIFTFLFMSFPSGLVMYWLVSNVLSIIQQAWINRKHA